MRDGRLWYWGSCSRLFLWQHWSASTTESQRVLPPQVYRNNCFFRFLGYAEKQAFGLYLQNFSCLPGSSATRDWTTAMYWRLIAQILPWNYTHLTLVDYMRVLFQYNSHTLMYTLIPHEILYAHTTYRCIFCSKSAVCENFLKIWFGEGNILIKELLSIYHRLAAQVKYI